MSTIQELQENFDNAEAAYNSSVEDFNKSKKGVFKKGNPNLKEAMLEREEEMNEAKLALEQAQDDVETEEPEAVETKESKKNNAPKDITDIHKQLKKSRDYHNKLSVEYGNCKDDKRKEEIIRIQKEEEEKRNELRSQL